MLSITLLAAIAGKFVWVAVVSAMRVARFLVRGYLFNPTSFQQ